MPSAQSQGGGARVGFPPPLVFLGLLAVGLVLQRWAWPLLLPLAFGARVPAGIVLAVAGAALILSARLLFLRTGQHPAPWRPSPELLVRGVYAYTRNPMYLGLTLVQLGLGVALGNGWVAALAPGGLLIVHFLAVRPEETYLTEKFGARYLGYTASVRRYL
jgi:protein-S-isoprenylcysteine O-methyltransferase Ste14